MEAFSKHNFVNTLFLEYAYVRGIEFPFVIHALLLLTSPSLPLGLELELDYDEDNDDDGGCTSLTTTVAVMQVPDRRQSAPNRVVFLFRLCRTVVAPVDSENHPAWAGRWICLFALGLQAPLFLGREFGSHGLPYI